jgi:predicted small lipoprotein YifL
MKRSIKKLLLGLMLLATLAGCAATGGGPTPEWMDYPDRYAL